MTKPICLLKFNEDRIALSRPMLALSELFEIFSKLMPDYHVLCTYVDNLEALFDVQVFHEKDFTEIQYEELKKLIENSINSRKGMLNNDR